jgi:hypothetical protein
MMEYGQNQMLIIAYSVSNILGLLILWAAAKNTKLARLLFVLLFAWASRTNYTTCHEHPEVYLEYSKAANSIYRNFINGWFHNHTTVMVSLIAFGQALIALGMLLKGTLVKLGCAGAIVFLMAIAPLGIYAGFPFSLTVSVAAYLVLKKDDKNYLWHFRNHKTST